MRIPTRKSEQLKRSYDDDVIHMTASGVKRMRDELTRLKHKQPQAIEEVDRTRQYGDFSENAEYQEAKFRLRRINARISTLTDRLNRVSVISSNASSSTVELGSTVTLANEERTSTYLIVGPQEANPSRGRISHLSPLGSNLLHHRVGEMVTIETPTGPKTYEIIGID